MGPSLEFDRSACHFWISIENSGSAESTISLDAVSAEQGDKMTGGIKGAWNKVVDNIRAISNLSYITVGIVLTPENTEDVNEIVRFAHDLGVSDMRLNPAAQHSDRIENCDVEEQLLANHPILSWRIQNARRGDTVRGLDITDPYHCWLPLDEMTTKDDFHYPCFVYMREGGKPIGRMGPATRAEREAWVREHDPFEDPICSANCPDICRAYNIRYELFHQYLVKTD